MAASTSVNVLNGLDIRINSLNILQSSLDKFVVESDTFCEMKKGGRNHGDHPRVSSFGTVFG